MGGDGGSADAGLRQGRDGGGRNHPRRRPHLVPLVDEMYAFIKARPELETTPNAEDSRMDFIDDDLDRDEEEEEEYED